MRDTTSISCRLSLGLALLLGALTLVRGAPFFLEEPILRTSPALGDIDLFGYALVLHRMDISGAPNDMDEALANTRIIVGAPNGSYPGGLPPFPGVNDTTAVDRTGLVYVCPVSPGECGSFPGAEDGDTNNIRLFDYEGNDAETIPALEILLGEKAEQFMGATLVSSGDYFMACAPRWISLNPSRTLGPFDLTRAHGRCFISSRNLTNFQILRPCTGGNSQTSGESFCMAGTSAAIYQSNVPSSYSVYMGGPPFDDSNGIVYQYEVTDDVIPPNPFIPSRFTAKRVWYTGWSVTNGRISSQDGSDIIYSLPKANNYKGSVEVFSGGAIMHEVSGKQFGEYFGWVVITADLNGDRYDEIIVGAPLFSTADKIEKGRIFIFKNNGTLDTENPIVITGVASKGRFGSAIVNLGDTNGDGFEDIAVSAPLEEQADSAEGTVYVFMGSAETYINETPADVITARGISDTIGLKGNQSLQSFGYSLSSGVDVDANFYYDLAIGGYKQQSIILLRTRSIANVSITPFTDPPGQLEYNVQNCTVDSVDFACFSLLIDASFSGIGLDGRALATIFTVTEDAVSSEERLFFLDSEGNITSTFTGNLDFSTTGTIVQENVTVYIKNNIVDRRSNLTVRVAVSSPERVPRTVNGNQDIIDLRDIPILNIQPMNNLVVELSLAGCGSNRICEPVLNLTVNETRYLNAARMVTSNTEILVTEVRYLEFILDYLTEDEDAIEPELVLDLPTQLLGTPESIESNTILPLPKRQCVADAINGQHTCDLQRIFSDYDGTLQVSIVIPVQDITGEEADANAVFTIKSAGREDSVSVPLSVSARAEIRIQEMAVSPNITQYEDTNLLGQRISARTVIFNSGPSDIPRSKLTILIPGKNELTGAFFFLYPTTSNQQDMVECVGLNPEGRTAFSSRRRRRSAGPSTLERLRRLMNDEPEAHSIQKRDITQGVDCSADPNSCSMIECTITNYKAASGSLTVVINSNIDNRFFRSQKGDFQFYASAKFEILDDFVEGDPVNLRSNKFLVQEPTQSKDPIPIWVYVLSGFGALFVIAVIIILLYLVGFFRLRRKARIIKERERRRSTQPTATTLAVTTTEDPNLDSKPEKPEDEELDEKPTGGGTDEPDEPDETEL